MTDATKLIAGLLLITVPTIEFGGTFLLSVLSGKHPELTEFQRSMFRPGRRGRLRSKVLWLFCVCVDVWICVADAVD